ncbi:MAG TPA: ABC transporter permease [Acidimicrobiales bacterium]|nr:ABC transporter permease [Acidimicrobiales bacterium]
MNDGRLVAHQARFDLRTFVRDPTATFFTLALPVIFLVLFVSIFGSQTLESGVETTTYYVPGIVALALVSATFVNLAISLTQQRESGVLKKVRGTPLPPWIFIAGRVVTAVVVGLAMAGVLVAIGRLFYGVALPGTAAAGFLVALVLGAAAFSALGIAVTAVVPTEAAAPAVANAITLPLFFISGIFVPAESIPDWLVSIADVFPVKPLNDSLFVAFDPATSGLGLAWGDLAVLAAWGVAGAVVAARGFRWIPRRG